ncbi:MAG: helix-turn-helix domain-containing protein [Candidatus Hermodarchaeota archaeon]
MESISKQLKEMVDEKQIFSCSKLFKCIIGLNDLESSVFSYILKHDDATTMKLTEEFNKDRSSIQRALIRLTDELNVVEKRSVSLKEYLSDEETNKRGYLYVYNAKDLDLIKQQLKELLDNWYESMSGYIDNLDSIFDCIVEQT